MANRFPQSRPGRRPGVFSALTFSIEETSYNERASLIQLIKDNGGHALPYPEDDRVTHIIVLSDIPPFTLVNLTEYRAGNRATYADLVSAGRWSANALMDTFGRREGDESTKGRGKTVVRVGWLEMCVDAGQLLEDDHHLGMEIIVQRDASDTPQNQQYLPSQPPVSRSDHPLPLSQRISGPSYSSAASTSAHHAQQPPVQTYSGVPEARYPTDRIARPQSPPRHYPSASQHDREQFPPRSGWVGSPPRAYDSSRDPRRPTVRDTRYEDRDSRHEDRHRPSTYRESATSHPPTGPSAHFTHSDFPSSAYRPDVPSSSYYERRPESAHQPAPRWEPTPSQSRYPHQHHSRYPSTSSTHNSASASAHRELESRPPRESYVDPRRERRSMEPSRPRDEGAFPSFPPTLPAADIAPRAPASHHATHVAGAALSTVAGFGWQPIPPPSAQAAADARQVDRYSIHSASSQMQPVAPSAPTRPRAFSPDARRAEQPEPVRPRSAVPKSPARPGAVQMLDMTSPDVTVKLEPQCRTSPSPPPAPAVPSSKTLSTPSRPLTPAGLAPSASDLFPSPVAVKPSPTSVPAGRRNNAITIDGDDSDDGAGAASNMAETSAAGAARAGRTASAESGKRARSPARSKSATPAVGSKQAAAASSKSASRSHLVTTAKDPRPNPPTIILGGGKRPKTLEVKKEQTSDAEEEILPARRQSGARAGSQVSADGRKDKPARKRIESSEERDASPGPSRRRRRIAKERESSLASDAPYPSPAATPNPSSSQFHSSSAEPAPPPPPPAASTSADRIFVSQWGKAVPFFVVQDRMSFALEFLIEQCGGELVDFTAATFIILPLPPGPYYTTTICPLLDPHPISGHGKLLVSHEYIQACKTRSTMLDVGPYEIILVAPPAASLDEEMIEGDSGEADDENGEPSSFGWGTGAPEPRQKYSHGTTSKSTKSTKRRASRPDPDDSSSTDGEGAGSGGNGGEAEDDSEDDIPLGVRHAARDDKGKAKKKGEGKVGRSKARRVESQTESPKWTRK